MWIEPPVLPPPPEPDEVPELPHAARVNAPTLASATKPPARLLLCPCCIKRVMAPALSLLPLLLSGAGAVCSRVGSQPPSRLGTCPRVHVGQEVPARGLPRRSRRSPSRTPIRRARGPAWCSAPPPAPPPGGPGRRSARRAAATLVRPSAPGTGRACCAARRSGCRRAGRARAADRGTGRRPCRPAL